MPVILVYDVFIYYQLYYTTKQLFILHNDW